MQTAKHHTAEPQDRAAAGPGLAPDQIRFDASPEDEEAIDSIVSRAECAGLISKNYDSLTCAMDLTAVHLNGNTLRLADLLDADDFSFVHDICGIAACLDRETGKLTKNFRPRFSVPVKDLEAQAA